MRSRILFISGREEDARQISQMVQTLPIAVEHVPSLHHARAKLRESDFDIVLTEAALPDGSWLDVLHLVRLCPQDLEVIITDPHADARLWSEALNLGAYDLIAQPFYEPEVRRILYNACVQHGGEHAPLAAV
ncbi:MAG TPA: response regulator [Bryobacteraceae bacterium]|jgi:DNA-binding NtrC family response regulator|nr:response regulator [Bryobacteraceae bacterium]